MKLIYHALLACLCIAAPGCWTSSGPEAVVYTALDSEFSKPIFEQFESESDIEVLGHFDTESTKTVGLTEQIIAERGQPRCDVFWNNEILNTLRLEKMGLLAEYQSPAAESYPAEFRSPSGTWHGFAARARVIVVNTKLVPEGERPTSIRDLADPSWRGQCGIAKPLFGTTATHAACLFAALGDEAAKQLFRDMKSNDVQIMSGNKEVALSVAAGRLRFGITDTDDAIIEVEKGMPIAIIYPDQSEQGLGTLFIPNTLAIMRGSRNQTEASRLVDYLLSPEVEARLAAGPSAQIPLNSQTKATARVETPRTVKPMQVDFYAAAKQWDAAANFLRDEFTGP